MSVSMSDEMREWILVRGRRGVPEPCQRRRQRSADAARLDAACEMKGRRVSMCSGRCAGARNAAASMGVLKAAARRSTESCGYPPADFNLVIMMIGEVFVALASPATRPPPTTTHAQTLRTPDAHPE